MDWDAASDADIDIPADMRSGRAVFYDRSGVPYYPQGRISQSETAVRVSRVLELATDVTPRIDWQDAFSNYFNIMVDKGTIPVLVAPNPQLRNMGGDVGLNQNVLEETKGFFVDLTQSEIFRGLLNRAIGEGRLGNTSQNRWTIRVMLPGAYQGGDVAGAGCSGVDLRQLTISIPYLKNPPEKRRFHLSKDGRLLAICPQRSTVRNYVEMLTAETLPSLDPWLREGRIDPQTFKTLGLGERGPLDYLAERIMREIGSPMVPLLSHLAFDESHGSFAQTAVAGGRGNAGARKFHWKSAMAQAIKDGGSFATLEKYVALQDRYLDSAFPPTTSPMARPMPPLTSMVAPATPMPLLTPMERPDTPMPPLTPMVRPETPMPPLTPMMRSETPMPPLTPMEGPQTPMSRLTPMGAAKSVVTSSPRVIDQPAADRVDISVPRSIVFGTPRGEAKRISRTPTVESTVRMFEAAGDLSIDPLWDTDFDLRFKVSVSDVRTSALALTNPHLRSAEGKKVFDQITSQRVRSLFLNLYRGSETFRSLVNHALEDGGRLIGTAWKLHVVLPCRPGNPAEFASLLTVDSGKRLAYIPVFDSVQHIRGEYYISTSKRVVAQQTRRTVLENFVRILTRGFSPRQSAMRYAGQRIDLASLDASVLGERGALGYTVDRIIGEMNVNNDPEWRLPPRLSEVSLDESQVVLPVPIDGTGRKSTQGTLNAAARRAVDNIGGLDNLEMYWQMQNAYLNALFPTGRSAAPSQPLAGPSGAGHKRPAGAPPEQAQARRSRFGEGERQWSA